MQAFSGKIVRDGNPVAEGIKGNLEIEITRNNAELWSGYFVLPSGVTVNNGEQYELVLDDGRSKKIEINRVNVYPTQTTASFSAPS